MNKTFILLITFSLSCFLTACNSHPSGTAQRHVVATVNDYELTLEEFRFQLANELELYNDTKTEPDVRKRFLDELIGKELLIQEARRLQLDRKEKFVRTIERYWESTLIRDLLEFKGNAFAKQAIAAQDQIQAEYEKRKKETADIRPFSEIKESIARELMEETKTRLLQEWVDQLRKQANIQIHPQAFETNQNGEIS